MKHTVILTFLMMLVVNIVRAQECDIQIQILEDKFMFGNVEKLNDPEPAKKMVVNFTRDVMEVILPVDGINYRINVINENCQAYCTREKRVRQLHSGDEKLVRNLFKEKKDDILFQIKSCNL